MYVWVSCKKVYRLHPISKGVYDLKQIQKHQTQEFQNITKDIPQEKILSGQPSQTKRSWENYPLALRE